MMSIHRIPLTELERTGLINHGLAVGSPSQLSDVFRHGMKWVTDNSVIKWISVGERLPAYGDDCLIVAEGFQSTRPGRSATEDAVKVGIGWLVSIHAPRAERDMQIESLSCVLSKVSIHAPRAERDINVVKKRHTKPLFQSTRPGRSATSLLVVA